MSIQVIEIMILKAAITMISYLTCVSLMPWKPSPNNKDKMLVGGKYNAKDG